MSAFIKKKLLVLFAKNYAIEKKKLVKWVCEKKKDLFV